MKCPKCNYIRQVRDDAYVPPTECPSCGIVYAKHESVATPISSSANRTAATPSLRPSPVDPGTLKKARDRVEKRLRSRLAAQPRDERHEKTLEIAKKLTTEELGKRHKHQTQPQEAVERPDAEEAKDVTRELEDVNHTQAQQMDPGETQIPSVDKTVEQPSVEAESESLKTDETHETVVETSTSTETGNEQEDNQAQTVRTSTSGQSDDRSFTDEEDSRHQSMEMGTEEDEADLPPAHMVSAASKKGGLNFSDGLMRLLPVVAWLMLFAGLTGAMLSWTTIGDVQAGVRIPDPHGEGNLPLGLLLGFAYLATGALGFAFFWVASLISRQLKDIRQLLLVHPISMMPEEQPYGQAGPREETPR